MIFQGRDLFPALFAAQKREAISFIFLFLFTVGQECANIKMNNL